MLDEVELFITRFRLINKFFEELFLDSLCYYFAVILKDRFETCTIYYDYEGFHFISYINGNFYDIRGNINELYENFDGLVKFDEMKLNESHDYDVVKKFCIDLE